MGIIEDLCQIISLQNSKLKKWKRMNKMGHYIYKCECGAIKLFSEKELKLQKKREEEFKCECDKIMDYVASYNDMLIELGRQIKYLNMLLNDEMKLLESCQ